MTEKDRAWREEYHFANCVIRSDTRELLRDGIAQKIERRSFDLILYLLQLEGRVASKDELLEHVWGNHFVSDSVIAQSIMKARKALGITGKEPGPIKTIHRVGYRFASEVSRPARATVPSIGCRRSSGLQRVLWLPTDGTLERADLSWVRYGLISVATHVLQGLGVSTVPASEAIQLHESSADRQGDETTAPQLKVLEVGLPVVHSRITTTPRHQYRLEWRMQLGGREYSNWNEGMAPAELALKAAREVALSLRTQQAAQPAAGQEEHFLDEAAQLIELAVSMDQAAQTFSLMAVCVEIPQCPLSIWAEFVWALALRDDAATGNFAHRFIERARRAGDSAHEGWAHLCNAHQQVYRRRLVEAVDLTQRGVAMVRQASPSVMQARALLLAAQVIATAGKAPEAAALWREASMLVAQRPTPVMVCRVHLMRCEIDQLDAGLPLAVEGRSDAQDASRWLGMTPLTARIHLLHALQSCARGDFDLCRRELDLALQASEGSADPRLRLLVRLHLGTFLARCGDEAGLRACVGAMDEPALRDAPLGQAVARWLRARQCHLAGDAAKALPLAEAAMEELADLGIWCAEDHWLFVAQLTLMTGNRRNARAMLLRLEDRYKHRPSPIRQATALAVQGMIEYAEGHAGKALGLFEQACRPARGTLMSNILLFGLSWLALVDGGNPPATQLAPAGQWVDETREGRHVRAMLHNKPYWAMSRRDHPMLLRPAGEPVPHQVSDVGVPGQTSYATHLPMPV